MLGGYVVSDDEVFDVMVFVWCYFKLVVELGGVVVLVLILFGKVDIKDCISCVVLFGGNVDLKIF